MNTEKYLKESARTNQRHNSGKFMTARQMEILHAAMGASTEANELLDIMKKNIFYGKDIDYINLKEEVGDILWYCALLLRECGLSFEEVMQINIDKLKARYPQKFAMEKALNRDIEAERIALEGEN